MADIIRFALCDDDEMERGIIRILINKYKEQHGYNIRLEEFTSGEELLKKNVKGYDLIILDIFMGGLNGIETAKELMRRNPGGKIIFCSASNEFAEESYDVEAFRYLVKPIVAEKMFQCLDRFFQLYTSIQVLEYKYQRTVRRMLLADVMWIEASGRKSIIHTQSEQLESTTSLAEFSEKLLEAGFVRPIRYALVQLQAVTQITADALVLKDGTEIAISREKRKEIKEAFDRFQSL